MAGSNGNEQETTNGQRDAKCETCGVTFKSRHGKLVHQGKKTECSPKPTQRKVDSTHKSKDHSDQDSHHSVQAVLVEAEESAATPEATPKIIPVERKAKLKLPPASSKAWQELDEDLDKVLESSLKGNAQKKVSAMVEIIYNVCQERFGTEENRERKQQEKGPSRRQKEIGKIRKELRSLKKAYKEGDAEERIGINMLRDDLRQRIITLRRAENMRKKKSEKKKTREEFFKSPFQFTGKVLGKPKSGVLESSKEEIEASVKSAHSDPHKGQPLGPKPNITPAHRPKHAFDTSDIKLEEVRSALAKARSSSAPGPSGLSYKIYKNCPRLTTRLWRIIKVLWRKKVLPDKWLVAEGCFVPKEENSSTIDQFREISLLSVEGKLFWTIIAKRMNSFLLDNNYVDTSM